jgi:hypothetical protein
VLEEEHAQKVRTREDEDSLGCFPVHVPSLALDHAHDPFPAHVLDQSPRWTQTRPSRTDIEVGWDRRVGDMGWSDQEA